MRKTLIAGIGNLFLSDDGFGVEVARRLAAVPMPDGVTVADFGIRGIHLAYEMLDGGYDEVVLVDACPHGGAPGSIVVFEAETGAAVEDVLAAADGHALDPASVLRLVQRLGGCRSRIVVVGCQPAVIDEGMELSAPVAAAIDEAVRTVIAHVSGEERWHVPGDSRTDCRLVG